MGNRFMWLLSHVCLAQMKAYAGRQPPEQKPVFFLEGFMLYITWDWDGVGWTVCLCLLCVTIVWNGYICT